MLTKEFIQTLLNKKGHLDSNKVKKLENFNIQEAYDIFHNTNQEICKCCGKAHPFLNFANGYKDNCANRDCKEWQRINNEKKLLTRSTKEKVISICGDCGKETLSRNTFKICPGCVKKNKTKNILQTKCDSLSQVIINVNELINNHKANTFNEILQSKYQRTYVYLVNYMGSENLSSLPEAIYRIVHNLKDTPNLPTCKCGCGVKTRFNSLERGYQTYSGETSCQWNDIDQRNLKSQGISKTLNAKTISNNLGKTSYYSSSYTNMKDVLYKFSRSTFNKNFHDFDSLEQFDNEIPLYEFIDNDDFNQRFYYFSNMLSKPKLCPTCNSRVHNYTLTYCSVGCVNNCEDIRTKIGKTNMEKFGFEFAIQSPEIKQLRTQNYFDEHGIYHHMHNTEIVDKIKVTNTQKFGNEWYLGSKFRTKFGYKTYEYVSPEGRLINYQGYEKFLLDDLFEKYEDSDVDTATFSFVYKSLQDTEHRYYPDCCVKSIDTYYEVKSLYTYKQSLKDDILRLKLQAVVDSGSDIILVIYSGNGDLLFEKDFKRNTTIKL